MDTLRSVAHLQRELGDDLFNVLVSSDNTDVVRQFAQKLAKDTVLVSSDNTDVVRQFAQKLAKDTLPTVMTVDGRTYDILGFLQGDEKSVVGHKMVERAKEMNANLGQDDGQHLLDHQGEIPVSFRGKVVFVFTDWRPPGRSGGVCCVCWSGDRWVEGLGWFDRAWGDGGRVLRRK